MQENMKLFGLRERGLCQQYGLEPLGKNKLSSLNLLWTLKVKKSVRNGLPLSRWRMP
uniref:Chloroplast mutator family protein n=1 Tax=Rhizophora mucronata TaxID=61149 RepID=A0A2P2J796_RHIMU